MIQKGETQLLPERGIVFEAGDRFGDLEIVGFTGVSDAGNVWALVCVYCGGADHFTTTRLMQFWRQGVRLRCRSCSQRGKGSPKTQLFFRNLWAKSKTLWSTNEETLLENQIRDDMAEYLGFYPGDTCDDDVVDFDELPVPGTVTVDRYPGLASTVIPGRRRPCTGRVPWYYTMNRANAEELTALKALRQKMAIRQGAEKARQQAIYRAREQEQAERREAALERSRIRREAWERAQPPPRPTNYEKYAFRAGMCNIASDLRWELAARDALRAGVVWLCRFGFPAVHISVRRDDERDGWHASGDNSDSEELLQYLLRLTNKLSLPTVELITVFHEINIVSRDGWDAYVRASIAKEAANKPVMISTPWRYG